MAFTLRVSLASARGWLMALPFAELHFVFMLTTTDEAFVVVDVG